MFSRAWAFSGFTNAMRETAVSGVRRSREEGGCACGGGWEAETEGLASCQQPVGKGRRGLRGKSDENINSCWGGGERGVLYRGLVEATRAKGGDKGATHVARELWRP